MCLNKLALNGRLPATWVDTRDCADDSIKIGRRIAEEGMIGFEYSDTDGGFSLSQPYFSYRFVGQFHGRPLIFIESSGGGTGRFTNLIALELGNHAVRAVESFASGDRCNGGTSNARITGGHLHYDQDITPLDIISLGSTQTKTHDLVNVGGTRETVRLMNDLESSATSCAATVHNSDGHWTALSLSAPNWSDRAGWTERFHYQACFNELYRSYVSRRMTELDHDGVVRFARAFADKCLVEP